MALLLVHIHLLYLLIWSRLSPFCSFGKHICISIDDTHGLYTNSFSSFYEYFHHWDFIMTMTFEPSYSRKMLNLRDFCLRLSAEILSCAYESVFAMTRSHAEWIVLLTTHLGMGKEIWILCSMYMKLKKHFHIPWSIMQIIFRIFLWQDLCMLPGRGSTPSWWQAMTWIREPLLLTWLNCNPSMDE